MWSGLWGGFRRRSLPLTPRGRSWHWAGPDSAPPKRPKHVLASENLLPALRTLSASVWGGPCPSGVETFPPPPLTSPAGAVCFASLSCPVSFRAVCQPDGQCPGGGAAEDPLRGGSAAGLRGDGARRRGVEAHPRQPRPPAAARSARLRTARLSPPPPSQTTTTLALTLPLASPSTPAWLGRNGGRAGRDVQLDCTIVSKLFWPVQGVRAAPRGQLFSPLNAICNSTTFKCGG